VVQWGAMARLARITLLLRFVVLGALAIDVAAGPPRAAVAANERGIAHLLADRAGPACDAFRQARELLPHDPVVARNLAAARAARGIQSMRARRAESALRDFESAHELHPTRLRYRVLLARARIEMGRDGDLLTARDALVAVLEDDPDHLEALVLLAGLDYRERRLEDGTARLEQARLLRPHDSRIQEKLLRMRRERDVERKYKSLPGSVFVIRYSPAIPLRRAEAVRGICEQAWTEICGRIGHYPEGQLVVTLYPRQDFQRATRLHGWVAGVSDGTIRLAVSERTRDSALGATLRHELTHHVVRDLAARTPVWLHEGLAQLFEGRDPDRAEARLRRYKHIDERELDRSILSERDSARVARFYDLTLAFTHFLEKRSGDRGIQEVLRMLREGSRVGPAIDKAYGASRAELFAAWLEALRRR